MKLFIMRIVFILFLLANSIATSAQFYIGPGAQVQLAGNAQITFRDIDLINNGTFSAGNSTVYFSGAADAFINGTQPVQFYTFQINKDLGRRITFQRPVGINNELQFSQGLVDLNGQDLDLGSTGLLIGESESSRIIGPAGGEVIFSTSLNTPSGINPGNLGSLISSPQNLGSVVIKRGHKSQNLANGSILRYYNISPANNTGLAATLRFQYFDSELNGLNENNLSLWRGEGLNWTDQGYTIRDASQNIVEKSGIGAFSTWTLSTSSAALPVTFAGFNLQCDRDKLIVRWKTAQETNSSHFVIERNTGAGWTAIRELPAAGNSSIEKSYVYVDSNPAGKAYYRIAQYDLDGKIKYTSIIIADCVATDALQAWPNPFKQTFDVRIQSDRIGLAQLSVVDAKGVVVIKKQLNLQTGFNQFDVDLKQASQGVYLLIVEWANGSEVKTMRVVKQ